MADMNNVVAPAIRSKASSAVPSPKPEPRALVDWEAVQREYGVGILSLAEIGALHGVSKGRISQVAKRDGWTRDLSARIRAKTQAKVNEAAALNSGLNAQRRADTDSQTVEAVSTLAANVLIGERADVADMRGIQRSLVAEFRAVADNAPALHELADALRQADQAKQSAVLAHVISLPQRIRALKDLAEMQVRTVDLEGRLFGITGAEGSPTALRDLPEEQLQQRLKTILERAGKRVEA